LDYSSEIQILLGLDDVKITVEDNLRRFRVLRVVGDYDIFTGVMTINKALVPYWFATFVTVLHESRHLQQRRIALLIYSTFVLITIGSILYNTFILITDYFLFSTIIPVVCIVGLIFAVLLFEMDAYRYEKGHQTDIIFMMAALEFSLVADSLQSRLVGRKLRALSQEMQKHVFGSIEK